MKNRYLLIMAGGIGSRFWPLSRKEKPKQFLDILGTGETLIQMTYRRFRGICPPENIYVVTNEDSSETVVSQLGIDRAAEAQHCSVHRLRSLPDYVRES